MLIIKIDFTKITCLFFNQVFTLYYIGTYATICHRVKTCFWNNSLYLRPALGGRIFFFSLPGPQKSISEIDFNKQFKGVLYSILHNYIKIHISFNQNIIEINVGEK